MDEIIVKSKIRNFKVKFIDNTNFVIDFLSIPHYVIFVGTIVYSLYKEKIFNKFPKEKIIILKLDEESKTINTAIKLYKILMTKKGKKNLTLISFGGGINQDISGFVASTLYRGINWIYVPTTLLAMADSSIGLKTSLNFESVKNMLGTFYPPTDVFIDINFLKTLKKKDYTSGVGEIMKLMLMKKNALVDIDIIIDKVDVLNQNKNKEKIIGIIKEAMKVKLNYMVGDEFDHGKRNLLNYGHEFGHAIEPVSNYQIPHGTAVVIGMIFANYISFKRGWMKERVYKLLNEKLFLPQVLESMVELKAEYFNTNRIMENLKKDKKRVSEGLVLILPQKNFALCKIQNLSTNEYKNGLIEVRKMLKV